MVTKVLPKKLPSSDAHGNYWLGQKTQCPAIFKSGLKGQIGRYFASTGDAEGGFGVLTDGGGLCYFDTPEAALKAIKKQLAGIHLSFREDS